MARQGQGGLGRRHLVMGVLLLAIGAVMLLSYSRLGSGHLNAHRVGLEQDRQRFAGAGRDVGGGA